MWWLSLALYAKSKRTPWVLRGLNDGTAFVGLGFSIDRKAGRGSHVVLGCSHMYNARGEGMEYRLSKVENPYGAVRIRSCLTTMLRVSAGPFRNCISRRDENCPAVS